jgi:hypothetical protein
VAAARSRFAAVAANSNFFTNAKAGKDNVQGWATDFDNPEHEKNEQMEIEKAIAASLKVEE